MKDLIIYGFGGFGREVSTIIYEINKLKQRWNLIGYVDDVNSVGSFNKYGMVLGGLDFLNDFNYEVDVVFAIASPEDVLRLRKMIYNSNISFPNIIAPTVNFFDSDAVLLGQGNVLCHNVRISCDVSIGDFNIINGSSSLGHDVMIGNYNLLQPETRISGKTTIGDVNFFGVRSLVLQGLKIGNNTRIGAGSVVMRKTKDGNTYFGNPAKILKLND